LASSERANSDNAQSRAQSRAMVIQTGLIYAALFSSAGLHQPFFPVWLADRKLTEPEIAIVLSLPNLLAILVTPMMGRIADAVGDRRRVVQATATIVLIFCFLLYFAQGFLPILLASTCMLTMRFSITPIFDAMALNLVRSGIARDFGRMRLWGSAAFMLASVAGGTLLAMGGPPLVFAAFAVASLSFALATLTLRPAPVDHTPPRVEEGNLFQRPAVLAVAVATALILCSQATFNSFGTIHLRRLGHADSIIGALWAMATLCEIGMFWIGPWFARHLGPFAVLMIAAGVALFRWSVMATDPGIGVTFALQMLHAATFSGAHIGLARFFAAAVSHRRSASYQATYGAITGAMMAAATFSMGPIYRSFAGASYLFAAILPALAIVILIVFRNRIFAELIATPEPVSSPPGRT
jgi:MFS transporter, PPP family, 3-phenylpropionic acid transporter